MLRSRVIPCLLIQNGGLVKTVNFQNPKYIGDPINAVKIFNEKQADELIILDIDATRLKKNPDYKLINFIAQEKINILRNINKKSLIAHIVVTKKI